MKRTRRLYVVVPVLLLGLVFGASGLAAASSANISHSYQTKDSIPVASLVSLDASQDNYVQPANLTTANKLVGVVVGANDSLVAIDSEDNRLQIATSGVATALVSNVNGEIKSGDMIAVSPFSGIGMKADYGSRLIGLAQSSLSGKEASISSKTVTDKDGKQQTIKVGYVKVSIAIGSAALKQKEDEKNFLQQLAKSVTGHYVSTFRLVISSFIAVMALIALVTLIYTSVYGTIVAIGRNPLAKSSIFRALLSVMGLVLMTSIVALATIYLIIR